MSYFFFEDQLPMPEQLLNAEGQLFSHCKQCEESLQNPPRTYTFEKVFKRYTNTEQPQVLFEYAICDDCATGIRQEISEESMMNMQAYFKNAAANRADEPEREQTIETRLQECLILGKSLATEKEYAWVARGFGNQLLVGEYPFAVSLTAMDELSSLLSEKTRDLFDDFVDRNFTGPPEFSQIPDGGGKWVLV